MSTRSEFHWYFGTDIALHPDRCVRTDYRILPDGSEEIVGIYIENLNEENTIHAQTDTPTREVSPDAE